MQASSDFRLRRYPGREKLASAKRKGYTQPIDTRAVPAVRSGPPFRKRWVLSSALLRTP